MEPSIKALLVAPCGMDCGICRAYLRDRNKCPGCRAGDENKAKSCLNCKIKNCGVFQNGKAKFCFECKEFPCERLRHLDKRYRTKYNMSMVENLEYIKRLGIRKFVENEKVKWACPGCGGAICVHGGICLSCTKKMKTGLKNKSGGEEDQLTAIPGVGKSIAQDLRDIGINSVSDLKGRDPELLYESSNKHAGAVQDRCLLYVFRCAVYFAEGGREAEKLEWWFWKDKK